MTFLYEQKWCKSTINTNRLCSPTTRTDNLHSQTDQSTELIQISRIKIKEEEDNDDNVNKVVLTIAIEQNI